MAVATICDACENPVVVDGDLVQVVNDEPVICPSCAANIREGVCALCGDRFLTPDTLICEDCKRDRDGYWDGDPPDDAA